MKHKKIFNILGVIIILALVYLCLFVCDETQFVIVTLFGKPVRTVNQAGIHLKTFLHSTTNFDKRLLIYDPTPSEYLTRDKKNVIVDSFACWKIIDPLRFYQTAGTIDGAERRLYDILYSELSAVLGNYDLPDLISIEPSNVKIDHIMNEVTENCRRKAERDFSIAIEDVKLKQLILPQQNKQSVFDRMRAERQRIAKMYRAEGEEEALKIRAKTDKEVKSLLSDAYRQSQIIKGEGDAESIRIYGEAYSSNPEFYKLIRTLEAYSKFLDEKTTVVLSSDSELLRLMTEGTGGMP
ncbi:protease modulator HflC [bacterium]|nr:protease modulator HflC [bacterium]